MLRNRRLCRPSLLIPHGGWPRERFRCRSVVHELYASSAIRLPLSEINDLLQDQELVGGGSCRMRACVHPQLRLCSVCQQAFTRRRNLLCIARVVELHRKRQVSQAELLGCRHNTRHRYGLDPSGRNGCRSTVCWPSLVLESLPFSL